MCCAFFQNNWLEVPRQPLTNPTFWHPLLKWTPKKPHDENDGAQAIGMNSFIGKSHTNHISTPTTEKRDHVVSRHAFFKRGNQRTYTCCRIVSSCDDVTNSRCGIDLVCEGMDCLLFVGSKQNKTKRPILFSAFGILCVLAKSGSHNLSSSATTQKGITILVCIFVANVHSLLVLQMMLPTCPCP